MSDLPQTSPGSAVRLLLPTDAPAYVALRRVMLVEAPYAFASDPESDRRSDPAVVAQSLSTPGYAIAGGFLADELVSTAVLIREDRPKRAHIASIVSVYTDPAHRARGLARAVITLLINTARTWPHLDAIELAVTDRAQTARRLYESLGFIPWGTQPDALRVAGESFAETFMRLPLRSPPRPAP